MKNFVKGMDKAGHGFQYVRNKFPNVSDAKVKEGLCMGPQIRELMQDKQTERNAWLSFKRICNSFLGNHKAANYQDVVQGLLTSYKAVKLGMQYESENPLSGVTLGFFSQKISSKSAMDIVKDFTKAL